MRLLILVIYLLSAIVLFQSYQILGYQWFFPKIIWAYDTLYLNYQAQREIVFKYKHGWGM